MKKSLILTAAALCSAVIFGSCASTQVSLQEGSPLAVVSILGSPDIPWLSDDPDEDSDSGLLTNMVNNAINSQNPELLTAVDRLDYADDSIRHILPEIAGCQLVDKDTVLSAKTYKRIHASYFNSFTPVKNATGYKDLSTLGAKNARYLLNELNAKSILIMDFSFYKKRLSKTECCGIATMKIRLLNERGKEIANREFTAETSKRIEVNSGDYEKEELVEAMKEAIDDVIRQFAMTYTSSLNNENQEVNENSEELNKYAVQIKMPAKESQKTSEVQTEAPAETKAE